jgi:hypothetical protein
MKRPVLIVAAFAVCAATAAFGQLAYTSFEEQPVFPGVKYTDPDTTTHQLHNHDGEPIVEWVGTNELGFTAWYTDTRGDVGLSDGDYVGVTDYTGDVGSYPDGVQGYEISDADGLMTVYLDAVALPGGVADVSLDYFIVETGYETDPLDRMRIWVEVDGGVELDILNTAPNDIDDLGIEGYWIHAALDLTGYATATLAFEADTNSGYEALYVDNIVFTPEPASLALLGLGALSLLRRR